MICHTIGMCSHMLAHSAGHGLSCATAATGLYCHPVVHPSPF